jgi:hypothetical protein
MPESENRAAQSVYDREAEFPHDETRSGRRRRPVADWGGDELFTRMPRRRSGHLVGQRRFARSDADAAEAPHDLDVNAESPAAAPNEGPREPRDDWGVSRGETRPPRGDSGVGRPETRRPDGDSGVGRPETRRPDGDGGIGRPETRQPRNDWGVGRGERRRPHHDWDLDVLDALVAGDPAGAGRPMPAEGGADAPEPAPGTYDAGGPSGAAQAPPPERQRPAGGVPGRRTVVIGRSGGAEHPHPDAPFASVSRRRPPPTVAERIGGRPEQLVGWAFALGLILILIAIATAHA